MITVNYEPSGYPSVHSPLFVEVQSNNSGLTDFKYLFDVYVNAALVTRQKVFPNPDDNKGYLDVSQIVRSYFESEIDTPTPGSTTPVGLGLGEFYVDFNLVYGEDITGTTYAGLVSGTTYQAYNWVKSKRELRNTPDHQVAAGSYFKSLTDYRLHFLTNRPNNTQVYYGHPLIITFWTYYGNISAYDLKIINETPSSTTNLISGSYNSPGAFDIGSAFSNYAEKFYIKAYEFLDTSPFVSLSFLPVCTGRYEPVTLMFLNRLGGWDSYTFGLANELSIDNEKKSFRQNQYSGRTDLTASGSVRESLKTFASTYNIKWKLTSNSLTKDEYRWLEELITSPLVYVYLNDPDSTRYWHPVQIKETNYSVKDHLIAKDNVLEINIEFADMLNAQYR